MAHFELAEVALSFMLFVLIQIALSADKRHTCRLVKAGGSELFSDEPAWQAFEREECRRNLGARPHAREKGQ